MVAEAISALGKAAWLSVRVPSVVARRAKDLTVRTVVYVHPIAFELVRILTLSAQKVEDYLGVY